MTGTGQTLCPTVQDNRPEVEPSGTTSDFTNLQEFSTYNVEVEARFMAFSSSPKVSTVETFMTPSAGM